MRGAPKRDLGGGDLMRLLGHHPGLLSGLVCAGANKPAPEGRDDGFLTTEEVGWLDLSGVERMDTAGAWLGYRTVKQFRAAGCEADLSGVKADQQALIDQVAAGDQPPEKAPRRLTAVLAVVDHAGAATIEMTREFIAQIAFLGVILTALGRTLLRPARLRLTPLIFHMEKVGFDALPIVGLISFLIGVVLAYQGADQLRRFGAEIFVVNLLGVSILREIGILLTAIVIAGRSGSAFTASIGSMKVREEIDAMRTLGLDPMDVLVMPRVVALVLTLPMLAFFADMMGLLGGCLLAWGALGISPGQFVDRLLDAIPMWTFWVGIIKAPVFAFLIALIGCFEGFQVSGSAESVSQYTTRAVVEAIFLVIVFDAAFSIMFAYLGI